MTPATRAAIAAASASFGVSADRIVSRSRVRKTMRARWAAIAILADAKYSLSHIGRELGLHHATVLHALKCAEYLPPEWFAKMSDAKAAAAIPPLETKTSSPAIGAPPTKFEKYGDGKPRDDKNRATAERCVDTIRKYWRSRGVKVNAEIVPVPTDKGTVYRIKSAGIPITSEENHA